MIKTKVLFIADNLRGGGTEKVLVNLVNYMDKSKFDIHVRTLFGGGVNKDKLSHDILYSSKNVASFSGISQMIKLIPARILYRFFVGCDDYDVVIAYSNGAATKIACGSKTKKRLAWMHGNILATSKPKFPTFFISKGAMQRSIRSFKYFVGVSKTICESFIKYTGVSENVILLHNTNDTVKIYESAKDKAVLPFDRNNDMLFCTVGSLNRIKGYDRLIKCAKRLKDDGKRFKVIILGEGAYRSDFEEMIKELSLADTVFLLGFQENPYKYIIISDAFICSSYSEGFSTAVSEAVILGKPVISTDVSGAKEILGENNEYGLVVDNSEEGIYNGMKRFLDEPELIEKYTAAAVERSDIFEPDKTVKDVEDLILSL